MAQLNHGANVQFGGVDIGAYLIIQGGVWWERLLAWIVTHARPVWLNHLLYEVYNWLLKNRNVGVYQVAEVIDATTITVR